MGETLAKKVVVVRENKDADGAHHGALFFDAVSGRQGLWQVASPLDLEPPTKKAARELLPVDVPVLALFVGRRVATAFGVRAAKWFELTAAGQHVYAVLPHPGPPKSRWWSRKNNVKEARDFLVSVVDHFSVRFGQPPGWVADIAPVLEIKERGRLMLHNATKDRTFSFTMDHRQVRVAPGREIPAYVGFEYPPLRVAWEPRLCAASAELRVVRELSSKRRDVQIYKTRGLTARELDKACSEPVYANAAEPVREDAVVVA